MIAIEWQDESGNRRGTYEGPPLTWEIMEHVPPATVCLRFIDPAGDTTFNQPQIPVLVEELAAWANSYPEPAIRHVMNFASGALGQVHTYLKFIGD